MRNQLEPHAPLMSLPMHVDPPRPEEVEASAAASPLLATLTQLREHLGTAGLPLSPAGGLKFDDPQAAAELFGIPLIADPEDAAAEVLSADLVPRGTLALGVAIECGAIEEVGDRLRAAPSWTEESTIAQASVALSTLIEIGPIWTSMPRGEPFFDLRDAALDDVFISWLVTLLPTGRAQRVDHFVNWAIDVCREQIGGDPFAQHGELDLWVDNATCYLIDTLVWAGAVEWTDREVRRNVLAPESRWFGGGTIRLTSLGRHVLPDHLAAAGIKLREPDVDGTQPAAALVGDVVVADDARRRELVAGWRRDLDDTERARLIAEVLLDTKLAPWRMAGFHVLELIGPEIAAPYVRQLLDSPSAEAAAQFLVSHGFADDDELRPFIGYGPLIDALASVATRPELLRQWFVRMLEQTEAPDLLLEVIALHPTPEATMVLTAAARHVTDPRFTDLIHAAEQLHHDCLAERDPAL